MLLFATSSLWNVNILDQFHIVTEFIYTNISCVSAVLTQKQIFKKCLCCPLCPPWNMFMMYPFVITERCRAEVSSQLQICKISLILIWKDSPVKWIQACKKRHNKPNKARQKRDRSVHSQHSENSPMWSIPEREITCLADKTDSPCSHISGPAPQAQQRQGYLDWPDAFGMESAVTLASPFLHREDNVVKFFVCFQHEAGGERGGKIKNKEFVKIQRNIMTT